MDLALSIVFLEFWLEHMPDQSERYQTIEFSNFIFIFFFTFDCLLTNNKASLILFSFLPEKIPLVHKMIIATCLSKCKIKMKYKSLIWLKKQKRKEINTFLNFKSE